MDGDGLAELLRLRHDILEVLADEQYTRHEIIDELPDSKSTVYKGLSQLQEAGLIERDEADEFTLTLFGSVSLSRYRTLAATADVGDLLAAVPQGAIDPTALVGADVVRPRETDVERHLDAFWELLEDAEHVSGVTPVVSPGYIDRFLAALDRGLTAELVLPAAVLDTLRTAHPDQLSTALDGAVLSETTADVPFGVVLTEGATPRMAIELRDGPLITGLVVNDTPDALDWAETTIDRFRTTATRVNPSAADRRDDS